MTNNTDTVCCMEYALWVFDCRCVLNVPVFLQDLFLCLLIDLLRQLQCLNGFTASFGMDIQLFAQELHLFNTLSAIIQKKETFCKTLLVILVSLDFTLSSWDSTMLRISSNLRLNSCSRFRISLSKSASISCHKLQKNRNCHALAQFITTSFSSWQ